MHHCYEENLELVDFGFLVYCWFSCMQANWMSRFIELRLERHSPQNEDT